MSEKLTVVGVNSGIIEKPSGWHSIEVMKPGNQYPLKLDTKIEALIQAARETKGEIATWTYTESESDQINPNNNKPYINRRLEGVELGASTASGNGAQQQVEAKHDVLAYGDEKRIIARQACLKAAATIYAGKAEGNFVDGSGDDIPLAVMKAAHRFEQDVYRDLDQTPFDKGGEPEVQEGWGEPLSEADDGIPF